MSPILWVALPVFCALVAGGLAYFVMESRMDVLLSNQREELAAARASLTAQKESLLESVRCAEESARRKALDEFLAEIRTEERQFAREPKTPGAAGKRLVRQERLFFRKIPLSNWIDQETPIEESGDPGKGEQAGDRPEPDKLASPPISAPVGEGLNGRIENPAKSALSKLRSWTAQAHTGDSQI